MGNAFMGWSRVGRATRQPRPRAGGACAPDPKGYRNGRPIEEPSSSRMGSNGCDDDPDEDVGRGFA